MTRITVRFKKRNLQYDIIDTSTCEVLYSGRHKTQENSFKRIDQLVKKNNWNIAIVSHQ